MEEFARKLKAAGVDTITGIPDSTLQQWCSYLEHEGRDTFSHIVPENEGAAVGLAIGEYLSTGRAACVYMQNSGLGNAVNPLTSLASTDVCGVPMLLLIGWRGEPGVKDEPQHKCMGRITASLLDLLGIGHAVMDGSTSGEELEGILGQARGSFSRGRQYAIIARTGAFEGRKLPGQGGRSGLAREEAIREVAGWLRPDDIIVSTTGKISRELYEQLDAARGSHGQAFLAVGGMGHAKMIAYGISRRKRNRRVVCLDGDGALLMHMGGMAVMGRNPQDNFIHICLDNEAHESVGGMATGAAGMDYGGIAGTCGYPGVYWAENVQELRKALQQAGEGGRMAFVQVKVATGAREGLGRPRETPWENREAFMETLKDEVGE